MAITNVSERFQERSANRTASGTTATRAFRVDTDNRHDGAVVVLSHQDLPVVGSTHPEDSTLTCRVIASNPHEDETSTYWITTCAYSNENEYSEDPLNEPPRFSWTTEQYQVPAVKDRNDEGIVNSAGDPFDPPPMRDQSRRIVVMRRNLSAVPTWVMDFEDAVNQFQFIIDGFVVPVEKAKCQRVAIGEERSRNGIDFREIQLEIHLSREGWKIEPLDEGFREIDPDDPSGTTRRKIKDPDTGEAVTAPVLLDGAGAELDDPSLANAVFGEFHPYRLRDFSSLPL